MVSPDDVGNGVVPSLIVAKLGAFVDMKHSVLQQSFATALGAFFRGGE